MSETSALRPGQKVHVPDAIVLGVNTRYDWANVRVGEHVVCLPASALTPVVEPEPTWSPGDVVRIDGVNYMLIGNVWRHASDGGLPLFRGSLSECWREGRVVVVYRKEADK